MVERREYWAEKSIDGYKARCSPEARIASARECCSANLMAGLEAIAFSERSSSDATDGKAGMVSGASSMDETGNPVSVERWRRRTSAEPRASARWRRTRAAVSFALFKS